MQMNPFLPFTKSGSGRSTRQGGRKPAALSPDRFAVDELSFVERVAMSAGLASHLHYYDLDNKPAGDWSGLFLADEALVLARILGYDRSEACARLLEDFAATPTDKLVQEIGQQARQYDVWLEQLERIGTPYADAVSQMMRAMVKNHLHRDLASIWPLFYRLTTLDDINTTGPIGIGQDDDTRIEHAVGRARLEGQEYAVKQLRSQLAAITGAISRLQDFVRTELPRSLESGHHDPATGMLIAFLQLYSTVQARINDFTRRHTDFYYRDCLYALPKAARPDCVHLVCRRDGDENRQVVVRRNATFSAGKDTTGKEILFRPDNDLTVGTARVTALHTLRLERDPLISPEHELHYATRAVATNIAISSNISKAATVTGPTPCWPLFGGAQGKGNAPAKIGLAVASRQLFLTEGKRSIHLSFHIKDRLEADAGVHDILHKHADMTAKAVAPVKAAIQDLFDKVLAADVLNNVPDSFSANVTISVVVIGQHVAGAVASIVPLLANAVNTADATNLHTLLQTHCNELLKLQRDMTRKVYRTHKVRNVQKTHQTRTADHAHLGTEEYIHACVSQLQSEQAPLRARLVGTHTSLNALFSRFVVLESSLVSGQGDVKRFLQQLAVQHAAHIAAFADNAADRYLHHFQVALVINASNREVFYARLGVFFRHWLLATNDRLTADELQAIRGRYGELTANENADKPGIDEGDPLCLIYRKARHDKSVVWLTPNRGLMFSRLISRVFTVKITTPQGWFKVNDAYAIRETDTAKTSEGFALAIKLYPQDPAVVGCSSELHGDGWGTALPILQLELNTGAHVFGYDLIGASLLSSLEVAVNVSEVRNVSLSNQLGRIDPAKPFNPFGPLPDLASYLIVGSAETAQKNLTAISLGVKWGGLPLNDGGFPEHYHAYGLQLPRFANLRNDTFAVSVALLRDGQWKKLGNDKQPLPLFSSDQDSTRLLPQMHLRVDEAALEGQACRPEHIDASTPYVYGLASRNGFFKFHLVSPAGAFGHAEYPHLLSHTIAANARRRMPLSSQVPLPNAPYTPLIEGITLNYHAAGTLRPGWPVDDDLAQPEKLFHLYPFGIREIHPAPTRDSPTVLPRFVGDGNLYIGIDGGAPGEAVSLLFHLREEAAIAAIPDDAPVQWRYLVGDEWVNMPADCILNDHTGGFLTSGIVRVILPEDIDRHHSILASGKYWLSLCVTAQRNTARFAGLYGVHAQALAATRVFDGTIATDIQRLPSGTIKASLETIVGLTELQQVGASFGMRPAENEAQMYTRMGERLRHKNRAVTAWDVERMVLEEFPHVYEVKCLPHAVSPLTTGCTDLVIRAGHILVVVLPMQFHMDRGQLRPHLSVIELERIREHLQRACPGTARIAVRNATYERIQVRCKVDLVQHSQVGLSLQAINTSLERYLSPWQDGVNEGHFDWVMRCKDVEAHLRTLPFVKSVTGLSLLRISEDDFGNYRLADTARTSDDAAAKAIDPGTRASWPWSIAAAMDWHLVEAIPSGRGGANAEADVATKDEPQVTGIGRLTVGGNYIIGSSDD